MEALQLDLLSENKRLGTKYDLPSVLYVNLKGSYQSGKYSIREWIVRSFFEGTRQMGFDGWAVHHEELRKSVEITAGIKIGRSTWFEINKKLENQGDILRVTKSVDPRGSHKMKTVIHFCQPLYFSAQKRGRIFENPSASETVVPISPKPTRAHNISPVQKPDSYKFSTKIIKEPSTRETTVFNNNSTKEPIKNKNFESWIHPIVFSLLCVFLGFKRAVNAGASALNKTERQIFDRARHELAHPNERSSHVEWGKWAKRNGREWQEMHPKLRESIAENQIIPYLADTSTLKRNPPKKIKHYPIAPPPPPPIELSDQEMAEIRARIIGDLEPDPKPKPKPPKNTLDPETLRILKEIKEKNAARARELEIWDDQRDNAELSKLSYR